MCVADYLKHLPAESEDRENMESKKTFNCYSVISVYFGIFVNLLTVLWHCWLGSSKGIRPVKIWGDGGGGHWLVRMEWRPAGLSMCLPLLIFLCIIKSRGSLLATAHWVVPEKGHKTVVVVVIHSRAPLTFTLPGFCVWKMRGKIIRTVPCCAVYDSCAQWYAPVCEQFWNLGVCFRFWFSILCVFLL